LHECWLGFFGLRQLCSRLLHNYRLGPRPGERAHVFKVTWRKTLLAGQFTLEVGGQPVDHLGTPTFVFLPSENQPPDVPIEREQFPVGRQPGLDPGSLHPRLDVRQQRRVIHRQRGGGLGGFFRALSHALRNARPALMRSGLVNPRLPELGELRRVALTPAINL
jgi:hypothetical protein